MLAVVLGVTAALTSYPPPDSLAAGPFSTTTQLGAARMELIVDPAQVGSNEITSTSPIRGQAPSSIASVSSTSR